MKKKIRWFWGGGGIRKSGPYLTQLAACNAAQTVEGGVVPGFYMWCEEVP